MRPDLDAYYLIDQYLENKLQGEELHAFEKRIGLDDSFAMQVKEQQLVNTFILEAELKIVRLQIEKDLNQLNTPSFFRMHWKWIGVSTLGLLAILFYTFNIGDENKKTTGTIEQKLVMPTNLEHSDNTISTNVKISKNTSGEIKLSNTIPQPAEKNTDSVQQIALDEVPVQQNSNLLHSTETFSPDVKEDIETKKIDCSTVKISFTLEPQPTCKDEEEGSISIENLTGGIAPYTILVDNKKYKERKINALGAGTYEIKITDKNGCKNDLKTIIKEKNCAVAVPKQTKFNINPTIGEVCSIPINPNKTGNLTIYNRSGKIIFRVTNNSNESIEWDGTDGYGSLVEQGLYVYIIEYSDGAKDSGEVNIVR